MANGLLIDATSFVSTASERCEACDATSIFAIASERSGVSSRSPSGAASTTRSAAPFWPPNFALIRSVAFCVSEPGILKSLISFPWNAALSPISRTNTDTQLTITRPGCRAHAPASAASPPEWAICSSSSHSFWIHRASTFPGSVMT